MYKKLNETDLISATTNDLEQQVLVEPDVAASLLKDQAIRVQALLLGMKELERKRSNNRDWWKTYRAALTGAIGFFDTDSEDEYIKAAHRRAAALADLAHGPLQPTPEQP